MTDIFATLREQALKKRASFKDDDFIIRALWKADVIIKMDITGGISQYTSIIAQTTGQGCCHCSKNISLEQNLIGKDARKFISSKNCTSIALLDSIYSSIPRTPQQVYELKGSLSEKTDKRSAVVTAEAEQLLKDKNSEKLRVVNVGVVGDFIKKLQEKNYQTFATDLNESIIGKSIHGVGIAHGSKTLEYIKNCDLAIITGMTLATDTLDEIVSTGKDYGTRFIMFAETGANFAEEYCHTIGIDAVISEPFPFYVHQGISKIEVYRR